MIYSIEQISYLLSSILFIFSLHWMNDPKTARRGVFAGVGAMLIAVLATWFQPLIIHHGWIILAIAAGFVVGVPLSRVPLTAVPQRTALSHAFGGIAAGLGRHGQVFPLAGRGSRKSYAISDDSYYSRDHSRIPDLHRQPFSGRKAAKRSSGFPKGQ